MPLPGGGERREWRKVGPELRYGECTVKLEVREQVSAMIPLICLFVLELKLTFVFDGEFISDRLKSLLGMATDGTR